MTEQWERWEPLPGLAKKYYMDSVSNDAEGFKVMLSEEDDKTKKVIVLFENSVAFYQSTNETFRLKTISFLNEHYGTDFYGYWTFFKVTNSPYIEWLSAQSFGISDSLPFKHFVIITPESILDVVSTYEPKVELLEGK